MMRTWFFFAGTFVILLLLFTHPIDTDGDFYHHMNVGRYILTHHTLPRVDDLTFTASGLPFAGNGWLAGVVFYLLYSQYGPLPINALSVLLALGALGMAYWYLHKCLEVSLRRSLIAILLVAPVLATRWPYRPEMFLYVFIFGFFLIDHYKQRVRWLPVLIPFLVLLESFFYSAGFPLVALVLVLLCIHTFLREKNLKKNWLYYGAVAISFPMAFLNGYGIQSLFFIQLLPKWTTLWGDWIGLWDLMLHPEMNFSKEIIIIYSVFTCFVILIGLTSWKMIKRYPIFALFALLVFSPYVANRLRTFTALLSLPFIGVVLSHARSKLLVYVAGVLAVLMTGYFIVVSPPGLGEDTVVFPPGLIQFIQRNNLIGNAFNTPRIGAFLSYHLSPGVKTFSDTRDDLFIGTGALEATQAFLSANASISYLLRKYDIDMVIVSAYDGTSFRDLAYDHDWALVYYNNPYLMFIPRDVAEQKNINIYDDVDPYSSSGRKEAL